MRQIPPIRAAHRLGRDVDDPPAAKRLERGVRRSEGRVQLCRGHRCGRTLQFLDDGRLARGPFAQRGQFLGGNVAGQGNKLPLQRSVSGFAHRPRQDAA
jgi:hypothetical protein